MTSYLNVNYDWTFENVPGLAKEVLGVVHQATDHEMGIVNCLPIKSGEEDLGCSLSFMTDSLYSVWRCVPSFQHCEYSVA